MSPKAWMQYRQNLLSSFGEHFGPNQTLYDEEGRIQKIISPQRFQCFSEGRLHGPSADIFGTVVYWYKGVRIPSHFWTLPEMLVFEEILSKKNTAVIAVGIEIALNANAFNIEKSLTRIHSDNWGTLLSHPSMDKFLILKVVNSTPEPDGSFRDYYLLVPPNMQTARQAVAWTFYKEEHEYNPDCES